MHVLCLGYLWFGVICQGRAGAEDAAVSVEISETDKPSESAEEQQAVLKRLGEIEEKVEEASKAASDAAEKAGKKVRGQDPRQADSKGTSVRLLCWGCLCGEEQLLGMWARGARARPCHDSPPPAWMDGFLSHSQVNAMANGILALEEEHTEINNRIDAFASGGGSGSAGSGKEVAGAVSAKVCC